MKFHRIQALLLKHYYTTINRPDRLFDMFYWPMIDLFVWGFASFYINQLSEINIISVLIGGIILWVFVWRGSQDIAVYLLEDFWSKNLYHLFSSPLRLSEHLASVIILAFSRAILTGLGMAAVSYAIYSFNLFKIPPIILGISVFLLSLFGWVMGIFVASMIFIFGQRIQVLAWSTVWVIQPFSCVFYPLAALPEWSRGIAEWLPTTYVFENMRASMQGGNVQLVSYLTPFLLSLLLLLLMLALVYASFRHAKKNGLLARGD